MLVRELYHLKWNSSKSRTVVEHGAQFQKSKNSCYIFKTDRASWDIIICHTSTNLNEHKQFEYERLKIFGAIFSNTWSWSDLWDVNRKVIHVRHMRIPIVCKNPEPCISKLNEQIQNIHHKFEPPLSSLKPKTLLLKLYHHLLWRFDGK